MKPDILMSIKPTYSNKIFNGDKSVELRKKFTRKDVSKIFVYSTSPVKLIVGYIRLEKVDRDDIWALWYKYSDKVGITRREYSDYFKDKTPGAALVIDTKFVFKNSIDPYLLFDNFRPPQSYRFLSNMESIKLLNQIRIGEGTD